jgi:hypothetical protein
MRQKKKKNKNKFRDKERNTKEYGQQPPSTSNRTNKERWINSMRTSQKERRFLQSKG